MLYVLITLAVAFAEDIFGDKGLVDAITLSLSNTVNGGGITEVLAWKLILLASLANLAFKGVLVLILGTSDLKKHITFVFGISIIAGLLIIWLGPEGWAF